MSKRTKELEDVVNLVSALPKKINTERTNGVKDQGIVIDLSVTEDAMDIALKNEVSNYENDINTRISQRSTLHSDKLIGNYSKLNSDKDDLTINDKDFDESETSVIFPAGSLNFVNKNKYYPKLSSEQLKTEDERMQRELKQLFNNKSIFKKYVEPVDPDTTSIATSIPRKRVAEMTKVLYSRQERYQPNPKYMDSQPELTWTDRYKTIYWLMGMHLRNRMYSNSFFIAVNIFDRFLSKRSVKKDKIRDIALTCLFVSAKMEDQRHSSVSEFIRRSELKLDPAQIQKYEYYIIATLNFDLQCATPLDFISKFDRITTCSTKVKLMGRYILELAALDTKMLMHLPTVQAAAALSLSQKMLDLDPWVIRNPGVPIDWDSIKLCSKQLLDLVAHHLKTPAYVKYSRPPFMKMSITAHEWCIKNKLKYRQLSARNRPSPADPDPVDVLNKRVRIDPDDPSPLKALTDKSMIGYMELQSLSQLEEQKNGNSGSESKLVKKSFSKFR